LRFMNKITLILIFLMIFSCRVSPQRLYKKFRRLNGFSFTFSDSGRRYLKLRFLTDTTLLITNRSSVLHSYYFLNFDSKYLYRRNEIGTVIVQSRIDSNKPLTTSTIYQKPYENRSYTMDSLAFRYIFPDIEGDTLRFSSDFKRLQVKEFCFERAK
jgi:hypothetical protein